MQKIQDKIEFYTFCYRVYWISSLFTLLGVFGLGVLAYVTKFKEVVTDSQLFLLVLTMLFALYLRINALHYHRLVVQLENLPRRRPMGEEPKQRPVRQPSRRAGHEK